MYVTYQWCLSHITYIMLYFAIFLWIICVFTSWTLRYEYISLWPCNAIEVLNCSADCFQTLIFHSIVDMNDNELVDWTRHFEWRKHAQINIYTYIRISNRRHISYAKSNCLSFQSILIDEPNRISYFIHKIWPSRA